MSKLSLTWHKEAKTILKEKNQAGAILSSTAIKLNKASLSLLGNPESVVLAYDIQLKVIAVKQHTEDDDSSIVIYKLSKLLRDESSTIRAKDFMKKVIDE